MVALSEAVLCTAGPLGQRALINCPCTTHTLYLLCYCTGGDVDVLVFPGDLHSHFLVVKPNCSEVVVCGCGQLWLTAVGGGGSGVCVSLCSAVRLHIDHISVMSLPLTAVLFGHGTPCSAVIHSTARQKSPWISKSVFPALFPPNFCPLQMHFLLLFSRQGKLRLQKWFVPITEREKKKVIRDMMMLVLARQPRSCNFLQWRDLKIVYKRCWPETRLLWICVIITRYVLVSRQIQACLLSRVDLWLCSRLMLNLCPLSKYPLITDTPSINNELTRPWQTGTVKLTEPDLDYWWGHCSDGATQCLSSSHHLHNLVIKVELMEVDRIRGTPHGIMWSTLGVKSGCLDFGASCRGRSGRRELFLLLNLF